MSHERCQRPDMASVCAGSANSQEGKGGWGSAREGGLWAHKRASLQMGTSAAASPSKSASSSGCTAAWSSFCRRERSKCKRVNAMHGAEGARDASDATRTRC